MFLFASELECPLTGGNVTFSVRNGLGNLDVVVLREKDRFLTSFLLAMLDSNEAVLILV